MSRQREDGRAKRGPLGFSYTRQFNDNNNNMKFQLAHNYLTSSKCACLQLRNLKLKIEDLE